MIHFSSKNFRLTPTHVPSVWRMKFILGYAAAYRELPLKSLQFKAIFLN